MFFQRCVLDRYIISGGKPLYGEVNISGAKNAAVAILPAALLCSDVCVIDNVPMVSDILTELEIFRELGVKADVIASNTVRIDARALNTYIATSSLNQKFRASYYLLGTFLSRFGRAKVSMPGGCNFGGERPIDQHIKGFEALGASVDVDGGIISAVSDDGLRGTHIYFDRVTVGGTINVMLAAVLTPGLTILENVAKEPHVVDLASFLNTMGADVIGAGTNLIRIRGVSSLHGCNYSIIPDQIEAGTYLAAVMATSGKVTVKNVIPRHLECITEKLREMGGEITAGEDSVTVTRTGRISPVNVRALPYPGFPTDMQPQFAAALSLADGESTITEEVWDNRFKYADALCAMGANIEVKPQKAVINGVASLSGASVVACDLRAGAAMVIAGLAAKGTTTVTNIHYVERGYENIVLKLRSLGADISLVKDE
ncbi:MAG: UDP-N-acetylglucosamine 1-carboxyvinyltransferase [Clostridia bacterium]|nr:UDP-N-acetylglucosamine 1-carboxyvinyltransferase [Clostridia bacterium]